MPSNGKEHLLDCCYCEHEWLNSLKEPCCACYYGSKQVLRKEFEEGADKEYDRCIRKEII
jgi:ribosomal protein L37E